MRSGNGVAARRQGRKRGFSLLELLVAVSIMVVMVYGLYQMFFQTQRALRGNISQVDVLESGRAALEIMSRELEFLGASSLSNGVNFYARSFSIPLNRPMVQYDIDEKTPLRTNVLQEFFFLAPITNSWVGTGYRVMNATNGVGTLYRFSRSTNQFYLNSQNLISAFQRELDQPRSTNLHRVAEGIVHLRVQAYDAAGHALTAYSTNMYPLYQMARMNARGTLSPYSNAGFNTNVVVREEFGDVTQVIFLSNALPAYVELELGVLDPGTYIKYQSILEASTSGADAFLKKQANKVHLFRKRIPIRTATQ